MSILPSAYYREKSMLLQRLPPSTASVPQSEPPCPRNKNPSCLPAGKRLPEIRYATAGDVCCNLRRSPGTAAPPHHKQTQTGSMPKRPAASRQRETPDKTATSAGADAPSIPPVPLPAPLFPPPVFPALSDCPLPCSKHIPHNQPQARRSIESAPGEGAGSSHERPKCHRLQTPFSAWPA